VVSGAETPQELEENVLVLKTLKPMSKDEMAAIVARTAKGPHGPKIEEYKRGAPTASGRPHRDGQPLV
jgi:hypothetical protein